MQEKARKRWRSFMNLLCLFSDPAFNNPFLHISQLFLPSAPPREPPYPQSHKNVTQPTPEVKRHSISPGPGLGTIGGGADVLVAEIKELFRVIG